MSKFFVLHGHFYQPPREDPWWQNVPRQDSAYPAHDWNERIYWECYLPNATARVYDNDGRIIDIVNNYSYINFNFGPTLLLWLKAHHPEFINFLTEADAFSRQKNNDHGNAIAQAYNHMILPLASDRDKDTQVYWGKKFFEGIFNREPEGMWLPETACNYATLKYLVKHGIKYIILSPYQAESVRRIGENNWHDVSQGNIDIQRAYRIFIDEKNEEFIDCFFYHGPLSHAISFQQIMHSAQSCAQRIIASYGLGDNLLVSIATDGETFGHHHPFSEMCLGYLVKYELPSHGILCTNFGNYLAKFPPEYEVRIKRGENDLGTSWSCAHGVKRWYDDCGCRIGFYPHWNQKWRKPLRDALDWLRAELDMIFEKFGYQIFNDPWQARNEYIQVIIEPSEENIKRFYAHYAKADDSHLVEGMKLLEMEHMGMLFYTSCGWFFDEISGIETVQNLKYAARAIQLAKEVSGEDLEEHFLKKLSSARSNIAKFGNGRGVYEMLVKPSYQDWENYISTYLVYNTFFESDRRFYKFEVDKTEEHKIAKGEHRVDIGRVKVKDVYTLEEKERFYLLKYEDCENLECYLANYDGEKFRELKTLFEGEVWITDSDKLAEVIYRFFPPQVYVIKDIHGEEQERIVKEVFLKRKHEIFSALNNVWEANLPLIEEYRDLGLRLPYEMHLLGISILNFRIKEALLNFLADYDFKYLNEVKEFIKQAREMKLELDLCEVKEIAREIAERLIMEIRENKPDRIDVLIRFQREMMNLEIDYYSYMVQNIIAELIQKEESPKLDELARVFSFEPQQFRETRKNT